MFTVLELGFEATLTHLAPLDRGATSAIAVGLAAAACIDSTKVQAIRGSHPKKYFFTWPPGMTSRE